MHTLVSFIWLGCDNGQCWLSYLAHASFVGSGYAGHSLWCSPDLVGTFVEKHFSFTRSLIAMSDILACLETVNMSEYSHLCLNNSCAFCVAAAITVKACLKQSLQKDLWHFSCYIGTYIHIFQGRQGNWQTRWIVQGWSYWKDLATAECSGNPAASAPTCRCQQATLNTLRIALSFDKIQYCSIDLLLGIFYLEPVENCQVIDCQVLQLLT